MSDQLQQIFKRIILHNRLLPEDELDALLNQTPEPEEAVQRMIRMQVLPPEMAEKLLKVYHKKIGKAADGPPSDLAAREEATTSASQSPVERRATTAKKSKTKPAKRAGKVGVKKDPIQLKEPGIDLIHQLLAETREAGASDLHIKAGMTPVVRVNSMLQNLPAPEVSAEACEKSLLAILNDEQRKEFLETSDLDFCYDGGEKLGRFRANFLREHRGMDAVFRTISNQVPSFEELNLPETVKKFTDYRVGIVLVTGPKGCGKTTTLAAMIDLINSTRAEHIITIEDPIEFVQPCKTGHVNQRQVGPHTKTFGNALRSALREAPDVIMVGEMRDLETTSLAITAAETGHLVLATLHTPDAIRTIGRVLDVFPAKEQAQVRAMIAESLRGVVSQLLLPSIDGQSMELAVEILVNTSAIGHLIRESRVHQIRGLMQTGKKLGMVLMDQSLVGLVKEGRISKEAALSHAEEIKFVKKELGIASEEPSEA